MITPEECYNFWNKKVQQKKGIYVKDIKNFTNAYNKSYWYNFEKLAKMCNNNHGQLDYKIYLSCLVDHYGGWFDPSLLCSLKSLKIMKSILKEKAFNTSPEYVESELWRSVKFVISYMKKKGYTNLDQYISEDAYLIPTILRHYSASSISLYFLAAIPNYNNFIKTNYSGDVIVDYIPNFDTNYKLYRQRLLQFKHPHKVNKFIQNIHLFFQKIK